MTHQEAAALQNMGLTPREIARLKKAIKGFYIVCTVQPGNIASISLPGTAKYLMGIKTVNRTTASANLSAFDVVLNNEKIIDQMNCAFSETTYGGTSTSDGYVDCWRVLTGKDVLNITVNTSAGGADTIYFAAYYLL
jgi:hypothetical protein